MLVSRFDRTLDDCPELRSECGELHEHSYRIESSDHRYRSVPYRNSRESHAERSGNVHRSSAAVVTSIQRDNESVSYGMVLLQWELVERIDVASNSRREREDADHYRID